MPVEMYSCMYCRIQRDYSVILCLRNQICSSQLCVLEGATHIHQVGRNLVLPCNA